MYVLAEPGVLAIMGLSHRRFLVPRRGERGERGVSDRASFGFVGWRGLCVGPFWGFPGKIRREEASELVFCFSGCMGLFAVASRALR